MLPVTVVTMLVAGLAVITFLIEQHKQEAENLPELVRIPVRIDDDYPRR